MRRSGAACRCDGRHAAFHAASDRVRVDVPTSPPARTSPPTCRREPIENRRQPANARRDEHRRACDRAAACASCVLMQPSRRWSAFGPRQTVELEDRFARNRVAAFRIESVAGQEPDATTMKPADGSRSTIATDQPASARRGITSARFPSQSRRRTCFAYRPPPTRPLTRTVSAPRTCP